MHSINQSNACTRHHWNGQVHTRRGSSWRSDKIRSFPKNRAQGEESHVRGAPILKHRTNGRDRTSIPGYSHTKTRNTPHECARRISTGDAAASFNPKTKHHQVLFFRSPCFTTFASNARPQDFQHFFHTSVGATSER